MMKYSQKHVNIIKHNALVVITVREKKQNIVKQKIKEDIGTASPIWNYDPNRIMQRSPQRNQKLLPINSIILDTNTCAQFSETKIIPDSQTVKLISHNHKDNNKRKIKRQGTFNIGRTLCSSFINS